MGRRRKKPKVKEKGKQGGKVRLDEERSTDEGLQGKEGAGV